MRPLKKQKKTLKKKTSCSIEKTTFYFLFIEHIVILKFYMALQNINFDKLMTKGFGSGPPQTFFFTVLLRDFEVATITNPLSETYQNRYSAEPC
jgi:uncharacterized membrane protein YwzB